MLASPVRMLFNKPRKFVRRRGGKKLPTFEVPAEICVDVVDEEGEDDRFDEEEEEEKEEKVGDVNDGDIVLTEWALAGKAKA